MDHLFGGIDQTDKGAEMLNTKGAERNDEGPPVEAQGAVVGGVRHAREGGNEAAGSK